MELKEYVIYWIASAPPPLKVDISMFNYTIQETATGINNISSYCWNWCKEQHFINQNNTIIEAMILPILAIISIFGSKILLTYSEYIEGAMDIKEEKVIRTAMILQDLSFWLLIGFLAWFNWFK